MKKKFLLLPLFAAVTFFTAFAGPGSESRAQEVFQQQFAGAENVQWSKVDGEYSKVAFTWSGYRTEAYYNQRGEFVGAIRGLLYAQLPLTVIRSADSQLKDHIVLEVREITNEEGTVYTLLTERNDKRYKIRLSADGHINAQKRVK